MSISCDQMQSWINSRAAPNWWLSHLKGTRLFLSCLAATQGNCSQQHAGGCLWTGVGLDCAVQCRDDCQMWRRWSVWNEALTGLFVGDVLVCPASGWAADSPQDRLRSPHKNCTSGNQGVYLIRPSVYCFRTFIWFSFQSSFAVNPQIKQLVYKFLETLAGFHWVFLGMSVAVLCFSKVLQSLRLTWWTGEAPRCLHRWCKHQTNEQRLRLVNCLLFCEALFSLAVGSVQTKQPHKYEFMTLSYILVCCIVPSLPYLQSDPSGLISLRGQ